MLPPQTRICAPVNSLATRLFHFEPKSLGANFTMLYVSPVTIQPKDTHVCLVIISTISANLFRLPKHTVSSYSIVPHFFLVSIENVKIRWDTLVKDWQQGDSILLQTERKPGRLDAATWKGLLEFFMSRHLFFPSYFVSLLWLRGLVITVTTNRLKTKVNLSDNYLQYYQEFIRMLEQFSNM